MLPEIKQEDKKIEESKTNWSNILQRGEEIAKRIETATQEAIKIYEKNAELTARKLLGGDTNATPQEKPKEETPAEYSKRIMSGKYTI